MNEFSPYRARIMAPPRFEPLPHVVFRGQFDSIQVPINIVGYAYNHVTFGMASNGELYPSYHLQGNYESQPLGPHA
jgi:hypothetical protein